MMSCVLACRDAALAGGRAIVGLRPVEVTDKPDAYVGAHAVVTGADYRAQAIVLETLRRFDETAWFLTEEVLVDQSLRNRVITNANLSELQDRRVFVIDELDGTSGHAVAHYEWSVSVAAVESLAHVGGAVFAPQVFGGALFVAARGGGAFLEIGGGPALRLCLPVTPPALKDSYVLVGPDAFLTRYPTHNRLLTMLGDACRTLNGNGSCALAMGLVAAGRADALIQPLQAPWDWAAGKLLVEEAGGLVLFYELRNGCITPIAKLELHHYDPDLKAVGFVAAPRALATEIMDMLISLSAT